MDASCVQGTKVFAAFDCPKALFDCPKAKLGTLIKHTILPSSGYSKCRKWLAEQTSFNM